MNSTLWRQIEIKRGASVPFGESGVWAAKKDRKAKTEREILQIRRLKGGVLCFLRKSTFTSIKQNDRGSFFAIFNGSVLTTLIAFSLGVRKKTNWRRRATWPLANWRKSDLHKSGKNNMMLYK